MKNIFIIFLIFVGVCFFNRFYFIPLVYGKLYTFSLKSYDKKDSLFKIMEHEKISDIYHKLAFLKESDKVDLFPQKISLRGTNLFFDAKGIEIHKKKKSQHTWAFYSLYEPLEFFQIFSSNGVTVGEAFNFLKFTFGIPFRVKDEINILYDIYINKEVYSSTLQRSSELLSRLIPSDSLLGINLNEKYILMIMDLYESSQKSLELILLSNGNDSLYEFMKNSSAGFKGVLILKK